MKRIAQLATVLLLTIASVVAADEVTVNARVLNMRSGPNGAKLRVLSEGDRLEVISERNGWLKVRYKGQVGYVFKRYTVPAPTEPKVMEVTASSLNLRSRPNGGVLAGLKAGDQVEEVLREGNWSKVTATVNGRTVTGWVFSQHIQPKSEGAAGAIEGMFDPRPAVDPAEAEAEAGDGYNEAADEHAGEDDPVETVGPVSAETRAAERARAEERAAARAAAAAAAANEGAANGGAADGGAANNGAADGGAANNGAANNGAANNGAANGGAASSDAGSLDPAAGASSGLADDTIGKKRVLASSLNLRAEPDLNAEVVAVLRRGAEVDLLNIDGDWSKVRAGSDTGWVASRYLGEPAPAGGAGRVNYGRYRVSDPLVRQVLERIAAQTGRTVIVTSGDRSYVPRGGSRTSLHLLRRAADFKVEGMGLRQAFDLVRGNQSSILSGAGFELIYHAPGTSTNAPHLHVGRRGSSTDKIRIETRGRYRAP